jgi:hypothetical protein
MNKIKKVRTKEDEPHSGSALKVSKYTWRCSMFFKTLLAPFPLLSQINHGATDLEL